MRSVLLPPSLIQRALSRYDARREFGDQERSVRIAGGERRAALAFLMLSKQNVFEQGKRFSQDEMAGSNFETETVKHKGKRYFANMQSQMTFLIQWFVG